MVAAVYETTAKTTPLPHQPRHTPPPPTATFLNLSSRYHHHTPHPSYAIKSSCTCWGSQGPCCWSWTMWPAISTTASPSTPLDQRSSFVALAVHRPWLSYHPWRHLLLPTTTWFSFAVTTKQNLQLSKFISACFFCNYFAQNSTQFLLVYSTYTYICIQKWYIFDFA